MKNYNSKNLHEHRVLSYKLTVLYMQTIGLQRVTELQKEYIDGFPSVVISDFYVKMSVRFGIKDPVLKTFFDSSVFFWDSSSIYYQKKNQTGSNDLYNIEKQVERWLTF